MGNFKTKKTIHDMAKHREREWTASIGGKD